MEIEYSTSYTKCPNCGKDGEWFKFGSMSICNRLGVSQFEFLVSCIACGASVALPGEPLSAEFEKALMANAPEGITAKKKRLVSMGCECRPAECSICNCDKDKDNEGS